MTPSPLLLTRLLAAHAARLLAAPFVAVLAALPTGLLFAALLPRRRPLPAPAPPEPAPPPAGGKAGGWRWSFELHEVLVDGVVMAVVPCRVLRRPGCTPFVIPLSRRGPLPACYRPSVN